MNRNRFLKTSASLWPLPFFPSRIWKRSENGLELPTNQQPTICPPYLKKGDTIGITSPSGFIRTNELKPALDQFKSWGLKVHIGKSIGQKDGTFGGTDESRAKDFQDLLDNPQIKAVLCARGGYGAIRIIDKINFSKIRTHPKWIIGFSDATVFHIHVATNYQVATLHAKMCNSFPDDWSHAPKLQQQTILSIRDALMNTRPMTYNAPHNIKNKPGQAEAEIIGGNLRTIENLSGTISSIQTAGKILFLEETHEYLYNMDRMLWNLQRSGQLSNLKGLIIGAMIRQQQRNPEDELNRSIYDLVLEKTKNYNYPICFNFPVGHIVDNFALKCGITHQLKITEKQTILREINKIA